jgi:hypothetical protein
VPGHPHAPDGITTLDPLDDRGEKDFDAQRAGTLRGRGVLAHIDRGGAADARGVQRKESLVGFVTVGEQRRLIGYCNAVAAQIAEGRTRARRS